MCWLDIVYVCVYGATQTYKSNITHARVSDAARYVNPTSVAHVFANSPHVFANSFHTLAPPPLAYQPCG